MRGSTPRPREEPDVLLMIDNYDSFTYNLVQLLAALGAEVRVERNDAISPAQVLAQVARLRREPGRR